MRQETLVSISEAARETGIHRATIHRQLKSGKSGLTRHPGNKVSLQEVEALKERRGVGRPCGVTLSDRQQARSEVEFYASPFLTSGVRGLLRLKRVLNFVQLYYLKQGRGDAAAAHLKEAAGFLEVMRDRHGADFLPGVDWKNPLWWTLPSHTRKTGLSANDGKKAIAALFSEAGI